MFQCSKLPCLGWRSADFLQGFFAQNVCKSSSNMRVLVLRFLWAKRSSSRDGLRAVRADWATDFFLTWAQFFGLPKIATIWPFYVKLFPICWRLIAFAEETVVVGLRFGRFSGWIGRFCVTKASGHTVFSSPRRERSTQRRAPSKKFAQILSTTYSQCGRKCDDNCRKSHMTAYPFWINIAAALVKHIFRSRVGLVLGSRLIKTCPTGEISPNLVTLPAHEGCCCCMAVVKKNLSPQLFFCLVHA
jgi:hypothetical protein